MGGGIPPGVHSNYLINGGFDYAVRQVPATLTTISANAYGSDRWRCHRENADLQYRRYKKGDSGSSFTGLNSQSYGRFLKITNTGKIYLDQPVEGINTYPLLVTGRPVSFQVKLRADSSRTFKIALVEWRGTEDAPTAAIVSTWGSNSVDPTLAANYVVVGTAKTCSVTTTFQTFQVNGTPSSSCVNLLVVIWSDSQVTATTGYLEVAEAGLYPSTSYEIWTPRLMAQEELLCQRYAYRVESAVNYSRYGIVHCDTTSTAVACQPHPTAMRTTPSLTTSGTGNLVIVENGNLRSLSSIVVGYTTRIMFGPLFTAIGTPFGVDNAAQFIDGGSNNSWFYLDAEM